MIGTPFAQTEESPGKGFNWGMATPHPALPRGTRIKTGTKGPLDQLLFGPQAVRTARKTWSVRYGSAWECAAPLASASCSKPRW